MLGAQPKQVNYSKPGEGKNYKLADDFDSARYDRARSRVTLEVLYLELPVFFKMSSA